MSGNELILLAPLSGVIYSLERVPDRNKFSQLMKHAFYAHILYQKLCDQPLFLFQLVDTCGNFSTAEVIQRHVLNNFPCVTHSTNGE
jgi:hypothetical protein